MSTDMQQQNNFNQDLDDEDNCNNQQNQQQYQGGNPNNFNDNDDDDEEEEDDDCDDDDQDQKPNRDDFDVPKFIRLRGLPWSATHKEILDFLKNINVINGAKGIHLVTSRWDGKNTGEAFVEVQSPSDVDTALKLNKNMMGHRYIEVFTANPKEAQAAMKKTGGPGQSYVVKLRGLPYAVTEQQVEEFFSGLEIKPDREGILFVMDRRGRATGEAYVQFESQEDTEQALGRNREKIGHRYIEIFRSSLAELKRSANGNGRPGPYDIKDRGGNRWDFGGGRNNMMRGGGGNDWNGGGGGSGGFGVGANNTLGFSSMNYNNSGNFGNGFGNNGGGGGGGNGGGNFGNNGGSGFGGNNGGGGGGSGGFGGNNSRFNGPNNGGGGGGGGNFSSDFGDFGNFGNNRSNNFNNGSNDFTGGSGFGGRSNNGSNFGTGGGNFGSNSNSNMGNFGNFGNGGNDGPNNMGGGGGGGFNNSNMGSSGGGNFGPIGGGRNDSEFYSVHMRGLPYSSYENDVFKFFDPIRPSNVRINFNKKGLHGGTADVFFDTYEDAQLAMKRHKDQIGNRYIELFFDGKIKAGGNNNNMSNNNFSRRI